MRTFDIQIEGRFVSFNDTEVAVSLWFVIHRLSFSTSRLRFEMVVAWTLSSLSGTVLPYLWHAKFIACDEKLQLWNGDYVLKIKLSQHKDDDLNPSDNLNHHFL